jgi:ABC-type multidrug transport system fused ATPase/permease subunit
MNILKKLMGLLTSKERNQAYFLLVMIMVMAFIDVIGVASILPFIAVLSNPEVVETNKFLNDAFSFSNKFGVQTKMQFLFVLGVVVFLLLITSLFFKAMTLYMQLRFTLMREYSISKRLVESYLHQPYDWFLKHHSADLGKTILSEVNFIIVYGIKPIMNLIAQSFVAFALITLLVVVNPKLALVVGSVLGMSYVIIYSSSRIFLKRIGSERVTVNQLRFKIVNESFGAAKEVKISNLEQSYIERFSIPAKIFARHQTSSQIISQIPRFALEAIAFGGLLFLILYLLKQNQNFFTILPTIALYAFAGYRLMPALQKIYSSITQIRFIGPALDLLHDQLNSLKPIISSQNQDKITLNESITLNNVCYKYPNTSETVLNNLNIKIPALSTVGFVGTTGSGKTTTIDIILGLFQAQKGSLKIDGKIIDKNNCKNWYKSIGYVPQNIYLTDDTIAANIAFGVETENINFETVKNVAKIANLDNYVSNELPKQYLTKIGEQGVRLSGGQRQRIGIARALYNNPQVLILDEATNALDSNTEKAVMKSINKLNKNITIIIIAHRLSTLKECDKIFVLKNGQIEEEGNYGNLLDTSKTFQKMITASNS